jgi:hypothetical protein
MRFEDEKKEGVMRSSTHCWWMTILCYGTLKRAHRVRVHRYVFRERRFFNSPRKIDG